MDPEKFHRESRTQKFYKEFRMDGRWFYQWEGNSLDGSQKAKVYENDNAIISVVGVTDEGIYFTEYIDTSEVRSFSAYSKVEFDNANKVQIYNRYDFFKELKARGLATGVLK